MNQPPKTITSHGCPTQIDGRGPNGRKFCRWCHNEVPKGRSSWCNDDCNKHGDFNFSKQFAKERDKNTCVICKSKKTPKKDYFKDNINYIMIEIDHIIPVFEGGSHHPDNLRVLCQKCHREVTKNQAKTRAEKRK